MYSEKCKKYVKCISSENSIYIKNVKKWEKLLSLF